MRQPPRAGRVKVESQARPRHAGRLDAPEHGGPSAADSERDGTDKFRPLSDLVSLAKGVLGRKAQLMIDKLHRDAAAKMVRQFRDGEITSDDLESSWPASEDSALDAIASMLWGFYDDHRPRRMSGRSSPTPGEKDALTRYAIFLDSDFPYEWPQANFYRIEGLGILKVFSLGLLWPLDQWIKRRNARFRSALNASGDFEVWPFIRREDYDIVMNQA